MIIRCVSPLLTALIVGAHQSSSADGDRAVLLEMSSSLATEGDRVLRDRIMAPRWFYNWDKAEKDWEVAVIDKGMDHSIRERVKGIFQTAKTVYLEANQGVDLLYPHEESFEVSFDVDPLAQTVGTQGVPKPETRNNPPPSNLQSDDVPPTYVPYAPPSQEPWMDSMRLLQLHAQAGDEVPNAEEGEEEGKKKHNDPVPTHDESQEASKDTRMKYGNHYDGIPPIGMIAEFYRELNDQKEQLLKAFNYLKFACFNYDKKECEQWKYLPSPGHTANDGLYHFHDADLEPARLEDGTPVGMDGNPKYESSVDVGMDEINHINRTQEDAAVARFEVPGPQCERNGKPGEGDSGAGGRRERSGYHFMFEDADASGGAAARDRETWSMRPSNNSSSRAPEPTVDSSTKKLSRSKEWYPSQGQDQAQMKEILRQWPAGDALRGMYNSTFRGNFNSTFNSTFNFTTANGTISGARDMSTNRTVALTPISTPFPQVDVNFTTPPDQERYTMRHTEGQPDSSGEVMTEAAPQQQKQGEQKYGHDLEEPVRGAKGGAENIDIKVKDDDGIWKSDGSPTAVEGAKALASKAANLNRDPKKKEAQRADKSTLDEDASAQKVGTVGQVPQTALSFTSNNAAANPTAPPAWMTDLSQDQP